MTHSWSAALLQPQVDSPLLQPMAVAYSENLFRNIFLQEGADHCNLYLLPLEDG
jgi:hypothetical protein